MSDDGPYDFVFRPGTDAAAALCEILKARRGIADEWEDL